MAGRKRGSMRTMRLRKVHCSECGYVVRMSRQWIEIGLPACPNPECKAFGAVLVCADPADAIECGLLSLDDLPRTVRTEICRQNGWEYEIVRTSPGRKSRTAHCQHVGCSRFVRQLERFCAEHAEAPMPF